MITASFKGRSAGLWRSALRILALSVIYTASAQTPPSLLADPDLDQRPLFSEAQGAAILGDLLPPLAQDALQPSPDPKNFEGTWFRDQIPAARIGRDMYGNKLPYTDKGRRILKRRVQAAKNGVGYVNASAQCRPPGTTFDIDLNFPFQIYQSEKAILFLFKEQHGIWNIRMNEPHRPDEVREYMGDSVGHWDGNTLVVDTINYKQPHWLDLDGTPVSKNVRIVYRIRRIDYGTPKLEIVTTFYDPELYSAPWSIIRNFAWRPDMSIFKEYNCELQVGAPNGLTRYGLIAEPEDD